MSIQVKEFGRLEDGGLVQQYDLQGAGGLAVSLLTWGATLQAVRFAGKDVILGFDTLTDYRENNHSYQGATVGRYANRIADGRFTLDGKTYTVSPNENGCTHLHGGFTGFDRKNWAAQVLSDGDAPSVRLTCVAEDGEEGYPGRLETAVTFTVTAENALVIRYDAVTDAPTVVNLTNHAYFNLNGWDGGDVRDTVLCINADRYTPVDDRLIPTGALAPVEGTPFDFRAPKAIGRDLSDELPGYDHNFVLNGEGLRCALTAYAPGTGIRLECWTDQPGVQLYTATALEESTGKGGRPMGRLQAFCAETQHFPDSPNHPEFPSTVLRPGEGLQSVTEYRFSR